MLPETFLGVLTNSYTIKHDDKIVNISAACFWPSSGKYCVAACIYPLNSHPPTYVYQPFQHKRETFIPLPHGTILRLHTSIVSGFSWECVKFP